MYAYLKYISNEENSKIQILSRSFQNAPRGLTPCTQVLLMRWCGFWAKNGFGNSRLLYTCSFGLNFDVPVYIFVGSRFGFGDLKMLIKLRNRSLKLILVIQRSFILGIMTNQLIKLRKI